MDKILAQLTSFFAIWFNDFKKHVFKVEVTNSKSSENSLLEKKIGAVVSSLDLVAKQLERSNSAQTTTYLKDLSLRIGDLTSNLKNTKELNILKLEELIGSLVQAVKRTEIIGRVSVDNLPPVQKVEGAVDVDFKSVLEGLQVVVDAINDLKIEMSHEMKGVGQIYAGQTGSRGSIKITDGTDTATITGVGSNKALDVNVVQSVAGGAGGGDASAANQDEQTALLTTIDADTSIIAAKDFATQTTLAAINAKMVTGTDIGDVTINNASGASAVNIQDGGNTITVDGTVAVTSAGITTIAGAVSGTEMQVDVITMPTTTVQATNLDIRDLASASDSVSVLQATHDNLNLNANLQVANSDVSATNAVPTKGAPSDIDINGSNANHADKYYTNAGAVTDGIIWSPAAGKRWHVLTLTINVSAAATVTIEDDLAAGDNARLKFEFAANSGITINYDKEHPFCSGEDAADLLITTTAGNVYVQAVGYEI